ncbi:MAG: DNA repair protein RecO, partial [Clostridia bacterium]|nr:DNA repair protein RecO [Clostridia bacterium]
CKDHPAPGSGEVGTAVVKAMRHVALSDFEKIFAFELGGDSLTRFGKVAEEYLLHKTQKHFKTLDFFKVIGS